MLSWKLPESSSTLKLLKLSTLTITVWPAVRGATSCDLSPSQSSLQPSSVPPHWSRITSEVSKSEPARSKT